jgi:hypothetical protein
VRCERFHPGGPAGHAQCSSWPRWRVPVFLPRQPLPTDDRSAEPIRRPGGWWLDYAEHATVLALAGVLAACRGSGCRILRALVVRYGCTWEWSPCWSFRITLDPGVVSAALLHCWSASVSALPPGAALNVK